MTPRPATELADARPGEIFAEMRAVCEREVIRSSELGEDLARAGQRLGDAALNRADVFHALGFVLSAIVITKGRADFKDITAAARAAFKEAAARRPPNAQSEAVQGPDQPRRARPQDSLPQG